MVPIAGASSFVVVPSAQLASRVERRAKERVPTVRPLGALRGPDSESESNVAVAPAQLRVSASSAHCSRLLQFRWPVLALPVPARPARRQLVLETRPQVRAAPRFDGRRESLHPRLPRRILPPANPQGLWNSWDWLLNETAKSNCCAPHIGPSTA